MLCVHIRIASPTYHFQYINENKLKLSQICSYCIFSKGLKDEFETAVVNEPPVFESLKFYSIYGIGKIYQTKSEDSDQSERMQGDFVFAVRTCA